MKLFFHQTERRKCRSESNPDPSIWSEEPIKKIEVITPELLGHSEDSVTIEIKETEENEL